jgi:iron complex outermembrane receptor protein
VVGGTQFAPAGRLRDDLKTFDLDFQHRVDLGRHQQLVWGIGFRHAHNVVENAPALAILPAKLDQQLYSAFVQDEIRLRDNLSVFAGTKLEHNDYTGFEFEPSVRLQWQPTERRTIWAAVSRAIRAPSRVDRDMLQAPPPGLTVLRGDDAFRSENLLAYELGMRAQIGLRAGISISLFHNEYTDLRSTAITPGTLLPFYFENNLAGHSRGGEFGGSMQLADNWSMRLDYNLLKTRLKVRNGAIDISNGLNETSDPDHQVSLRSSLDLPGNVHLDGGLRWVDSLRNNNGPNPGNVPDYVELDLRLAWHFAPGFELSVAGQNLLHARHPEYGFPSPTRAEAERSVHGTLVWRR